MCVWISLLVADCFRAQRESSYFVLDELLGSFFDFALKVKKMKTETGHCTDKHGLSGVA